MTEQWKPSASDIAWLQNLVRSLKVGGMWAAPIGFTFKKTAENRLELDTVSTTGLVNTVEVMETIDRTVEVAKAAGIEVVATGTARAVILDLRDLRGGG